MLEPFIYQPRPWHDNDNGGGDWHPIGPFYFMMIALAVVVLLCGVATVFAAELAVPRRSVIVPVDPRCRTAARYDAMREAYERRLPDPCNGAKEWRR